MERRSGPRLQGNLTGGLVERLGSERANLHSHQRLLIAKEFGPLDFVLGLTDRARFLGLLQIDQLLTQGSPGFRTITIPDRGHASAQK